MQVVGNTPIASLVQSKSVEVSGQVHEGLGNGNLKRALFGECGERCGPAFGRGLQLAWNDFLFAAVLTNNATQTLPVLMAGFSGGDSGVDWGGNGR